MPNAVILFLNVCSILTRVYKHLIKAIKGSAIFHTSNMCNGVTFGWYDGVCHSTKGQANCDLLENINLLPVPFPCSEYFLNSTILTTLFLHCYFSGTDPGF